MTDQQRLEGLVEWNRIARENTENAIVSSMFEASSEAIVPIESFATWLLVGAAATASFLLGSSDKLVPIIGSKGFLWCGLLLGASCLCGVLAKAFALRATIGQKVGVAVNQTFQAHLQAHEQDEQKIQQHAMTLGITLESGINMERVLSEFLAPMPPWVTWLVRRSLKKNGSNPQLAYLPRIKNMNRLGLFAFLQALAFLAFLVLGFASAAAT